MNPKELKSADEQRTDAAPINKLHAFLMHFRRELTTVKQAWVFFSLIVGAGIALAYGFDRAYIIAGQEVTIKRLKEEMNFISRDSDKLAKEVDQLRIYRSRDMMPLKKTALILAQQIREFTRNWKDTDPPNLRYPNIQRYLQRFGLRASIMRDDLDQNGQQSDDLDKVMNNFYRECDYQEVRTIAFQIETLANKLPD